VNVEWCWMYLHHRCNTCLQHYKIFNKHLFAILSTFIIVTNLTWNVEKALLSSWRSQAFVYFAEVSGNEFCRTHKLTALPQLDWRAYCVTTYQQVSSTFSSKDGIRYGALSHYLRIEILFCRSSTGVESLAGWHSTALHVSTFKRHLKTYLFMTAFSC